MKVGAYLKTNGVNNPYQRQARNAHLPRNPAGCQKI